MCIRDSSHADFPNGDGTSFYAKYPGVDDVNGLINGKPVVMAGKFGDHLGIMDVKLTYTCLLYTSSVK